MDYRNVIRFKDQLEWKPVKRLYVKNGGWSPAKTAWVKIDGAWRQVYPAPRANCIFDPISLIIPTTYINTDSGKKRVYISNNGNEVLTINSIDVGTCTEFDITVDTSSWGGSSTTVPVGGQVFIDISIKGKVLGFGSATLTINTVNSVYGPEPNVFAINSQVVPLFASLEWTRRWYETVSFKYEQYVRKVIGYTSSGGILGFLKSKPIYSTKPALPSASITVKNSGNTGLEITSITVDNDLYDISAWKAAVPANSTQTITFTLNEIKALERLAAGQAYDFPGIVIKSTASNGTPVPDLSISTTLQLVPHGSFYRDQGYTSTTWTVPAGIDNDTTIRVRANSGGAGGNDSHPGGAGGPGGDYAVTATLPAGSTITTYFGTAGSNGASGSPVAGGAKGVNATFPEYNGGDGGSCGAAGWSGSGGGGAAATVVQVREPGGFLILKIVAGGGAGGGGGGNYSNGLTANWTPYQSPTGSFVGGPGQNKGGDGGGGGGGGGGSRGGNGGTVNGGDSGGNPGYTGENNHTQLYYPTVTSVVTDSWNKVGYASVEISW
jgi:hypothetical protein